MAFSAKCNNSIGRMSGQSLTKKFPKSLGGGSVTISSGNTTYRTVPATCYEPLVRHCFKAHQIKAEGTEYAAKQFSSQARPGGFLTRMTSSPGKANSRLVTGGSN